jgi:uncharacterized membrane protein YdbT with pleckstrin-like domain
MSMGFFPAFFDQPQNMHFIEQNDDEKIELLLRKHPITNLPWIVISILAFFLPFLILTADRAFAVNLIEQLPGTVAIELLIMYDLLIIAYAIESFLYWYFNIYIVTNQHVVDITFDSLLNREVTESQYEELQTVTARVKGVIREFFNFGSVFIETAAKDENLIFADVPNPDQVADRIRDIQQTVN